MQEPPVPHAYAVEEDLRNFMCHGIMPRTISRRNRASKGSINRQLIIPSDKTEQTPFTHTLDALYHHIVESDHNRAHSMAEDAFHELSQQFGCDDSYVDVAGCLNDIAVMKMSLDKPDEALKQLKRGLMMTERSYRVDVHLRTCLMSNMMTIHARTSRSDMDDCSDEVIHYTNQLIELLSDASQLQKPGTATTAAKGGVTAEKDLPCIQHIHPGIRKAECFFALSESITHHFTHTYRFEEGVARMEQGFACLNQLEELPDFYSRRLLVYVLGHLRQAQQSSIRSRGQPISHSHLPEVAQGEGVGPNTADGASNDTGGTEAARLIRRLLPSHLDQHQQHPKANVYAMDAEELEGLMRRLKGPITQWGMFPMGLSLMALG